MPERNVLRVYANWQYEGLRQVRRYYSSIHQETGRAFDLQGKLNDDEYLVGTVNSILDNLGQVLAVVNAGERFKSWVYWAQYLGNQYAIIIPDNLVRDYGVREGEYLDITFTEIQRPSYRGGSILIFPKVLRYGQLNIETKTLPAQIRPQLAEVLIEKRFNEPFFSDLIIEINLAYAFGLMRSAVILYRTLLENLLIELLRSKFGMTRGNLFFDQSRRRFHDLSILINNFRVNVSEFAPYSVALDAGFVQSLNKYRERANASAHHLELGNAQDFLTANKSEMNEVCEILVTAVERISQRNL